MQNGNIYMQRGLLLSTLLRWSKSCYSDTTKPLWLYYFSFLLISLSFQGWYFSDFQKRQSLTHRYKKMTNIYFSKFGLNTLSNSIRDFYLFIWYLFFNHLTFVNSEKRFRFLNVYSVSQVWLIYIVLWKIKLWSSK